jgi:hypothetical protein
MKEDILPLKVLQVVMRTIMAQRASVAVAVAQAK